MGVSKHLSLLYLLLFISILLDWKLDRTGQDRTAATLDGSSELPSCIEELKPELMR